MDDKTEVIEKLSNSPKVTQLLSDKLKFEPRQTGSRLLTHNHYISTDF